MAGLASDRVFEIAQKAQKNIANAQQAALTEAGLAGKRDALANLARVQPSMGFSHYSPKAPGAKGARKFFVRYRYRKLEGGNAQVVLWAVPPGPQLVEKGRGHGNATARTSYRVARLSKRLDKRKTSGRGSGVTRGKPWWRATVSTAGPQMLTIVRNRNITAFRRAVER